MPPKMRIQISDHCQTLCMQPQVTILVLLLMKSKKEVALKFSSNTRAAAQFFNMYESRTQKINKNILSFLQTRLDNLK